MRISEGQKTEDPLYSFYYIVDLAHQWFFYFGFAPKPCSESSEIHSMNIIKAVSRDLDQ